MHYLALPILLSCFIVSVYSQNVKTDPQFTDAVPAARALNDSTTTNDRSSQQLQDALVREQQLKLQLAQAQNLLNARNIVPGPGVAGQNPQSAQDQAALTSKLFGPNGLMNILNPKIMDQQDAAQKLIPALTIPNQQQPRSQTLPFNQNQQFPQQNVLPQQQMYPQQVPFQGQPGFGQPSSFNQFPGQNQGLMPQQSFQQPSFASPYGLNAGVPSLAQPNMFPQQAVQQQPMNMGNGFLG